MKKEKTNFVVILVVAYLYMACSVSMATTIPERATKTAAAAEVTHEDIMSPSSKGTCSLKTLKGTYIYAAAGTLKSGTISTRENGITVYDGKGGFVTKASFNDVPGISTSFVVQNGSYIINSDCTGWIASGETRFADIFVSPDGSFLTVISTLEGVQMNSEEKRASTKILEITP